MTTQYIPPGRLGDPSMSLGSDPRTNKKLAQILTALGMTENAPGTELSPKSSLLEQMKKELTQFEAMFEQLFESLPDELPGDKSKPKVERKDITIKGKDGNDILLHTFRKAGTDDEKLPGVVYLHGGGKVLIKTLTKVHIQWCIDLALAGVMVIMIDFRNAFQSEARGGAHYPFPAGLNDCVSGVRHVIENKSQLGIDKVVLQGESGGASLALAVAIQANKQGWVEFVDGVYACCPAISDAPCWPEERRIRELPSTIENAGYLLNSTTMAVTDSFYTSNEADTTNPLVSPYHASISDLKGLPPHILVMDELDPLRDEGIAYARKLVEAGVSTISSLNLGMTHAAYLIFRQALPDLRFTTVNNIVAFARSL